MKHPDTKQRLFQPLQIRPTNQMNEDRETSRNRNNEDGNTAKKKSVPNRRVQLANSSDSESDIESDGEVLLSLLVNSKPTKSTSMTPQKRQRRSQQPNNSKRFRSLEGFTSILLK